MIENINKTIDPEFGYGGVFNEGAKRVEPSIREIDYLGKKWIEITEIPVSSSLSIINNDKFISELRMSGQVEIIVDISKANFSIKMWAPKEVIDYIIQKASIAPKTQDMYYWKRVRTSGFIDEWVKERRVFTKSKLYYEAAHVFHTDLVNEAINAIHAKISARVTTGAEFQDMVKDITSKVYDKYAVYPSGSEKYALSKDEFSGIILAKPIGSIVPKKVGSLKMDKLTAKDVNEFIIDEIAAIKENKYTAKSVRQKSTMAFSTQVTIKRYVIMKQNAVSVSFNKTPRFQNYEITGDLYVFFEDGTCELINSKFVGEYTSDKNIVGFVEYGSYFLVHTVSDKLISYKRFGSMKEPIKFISPAKKVNVDGTEHTIGPDFYVASFNKYRVVE